MTVDPRTPAEPPPPFRPARPVVIGVLGGIAAGKSAVTRAFAAHGLVPVDADAQARAVTGRPEILARIGAAFGADMLDGDGRLRRDRLAAVVFGDPERRRALEEIVLPATRTAILAAITDARAAGSSVVLDAPLLLETGLDALCDHLVYVDVADAVRAARAADRGWAAGELARREAAQVPLAVKKARAGTTIRNDGSPAETAAQVAALLATLAGTGGAGLPPRS